MPTQTLKKIDYHIAIWGLIAIALALVFGGWMPMVSASAGAVLGMINWMIFRKLTQKLVSIGDRLGVGVFLSIKFMMLLAAVSLLLLLTPIRPIAFTVGISALFLGISSWYISHLLHEGTTALRGDD
jgi:hypothetical protein